MNVSNDFLNQALLTSPISVQSADEPNKPRVQGFLVGRHLKDFLLFGGLKALNMKPGETLVVRMLLGNEVVGFRTTVQGLLHEQPPVWRVAFPEQVETVNLRRAPRLAVFFPTDVRAKHDAPDTQSVHMLRAIVLNLSNGGCRFSSKTQVSAKETVHLSFSLPGDRLVQTLTGEVLEAGRSRQVYSQRVRFTNGAAQKGPLAQIAEWMQINAPFSFY